MRRADLIAGLSVAGLMLPETVAYAEIAGVPAQRGILAGIAGCIVYALVGRSRFAIVAPTSSSAAILAATLAATPGDASVKLAAATIVTGLVGALFLLAGFARLGGLAGFISRPVLRGFAFGLAITIILRQLPALAGISVKASDLFHLIVGLATSASHWNVASLGVGLAALALLMALRRVPAVPSAFLVLAGGIAVSAAFDLPARGVAVVGMIDAMPTWPALPMPTGPGFSRLILLTLPLVLILFAESWGTIRGLALRNGDAVDADRELGALGAANLASALAQGIPVGAGFSAGAASEAAGAATRTTAVVAGLGLALLIAYAAPWVARLPEAVLAAVVIAAVSRALDPAPLVRLWRLNRDPLVALGAAAAVLAFGVLDGMMVAIVLSLAALVRRLATPRIVALGRLGQTRDYVDMSRHSDAACPSGVAIWRPDQPLFFANAERVLGVIAARTRALSNVHAVVVSLEESFDLDSTALDALMEFDASMRASGVRVQFARVHDHVRDLLARAGPPDLNSRSSYSVDDAVRAVQSLAVDPETAP